MILKMCAKCKKTVVYPARYCDECKKIVDEHRKERLAEYKKKSNKKYDSNRDPKYKKFYNSNEWRRLSASYMSKCSYLCERCNRIATQVHHKIYIKSDEGWNKRFDIDNLEALCDKCHNEEHKRFTTHKSRTHQNRI